MPEFEITREDRIRVDMMMEFIQREFQDMTTEARMMFTMEFIRLAKSEIAKLKELGNA